MPKRRDLPSSWTGRAGTSRIQFMGINPFSYSALCPFFHALDVNLYIHAEHLSSERIPAYCSELDLRCSRPPEVRRRRGSRRRMVGSPAISTRKGLLFSKTRYGRLGDGIYSDAHPIFSFARNEKNFNVCTPPGPERLCSNFSELCHLASIRSSRAICEAPDRTRDIFLHE